MDYDKETAWRNSNGFFSNFDHRILYMQTCTVGFLRVQKLRRPCGHALTYRSENFARFMQIIFRKNLVSISNDSNLSNAHRLIVTSLTKKKKKKHPRFTIFLQSILYKDFIS